MVTVIEDYIPIGRKNRPAKVNPCNYITIHNTGNASYGANAKNHAAYVKSDSAANSLVSWHYTVDDTIIFKHLPDNETAYHAGDGSGSGNTKSIGIEICMNGDGNLLKATDNAAEITESLCKKHNIPITNIVQHNHWTEKNCPQMIRGNSPYNWTVFINKVNESLNQALPPPTPPIDNIRFNVMGNVIDIPGLLINDSNYVSARALLEALGFTASWDDQTKTVNVLNSAIKIDLFGDKIVKIPGNVINDTTYVGLRTLMEVMGFEVGWKPEEQIVTISKKAGMTYIRR